MDEKKKQALDIALGQIEKQFGKGSIMRMGDGSVVHDVSVVSTGSLGLDLALGIGGLPRGRVVEIYGPESSGKTTLALHVAAEIQKAGGTAAFVDAEHAWIRATRKNSGWKLQTCWSPNRIRVNRPWRSPTCWFDPAPQTWSLSTPSRH